MTLKDIEAMCQSCDKCQLGATRTNLVFGTGVPDCGIMLVGEGPGANEDAEGVPFVGRAGKLLDDMLKIIDLDRQKNVYIANIVKCRPPNNRDPLPAEQAACMDWLNAQMAVINPKMVICLGRIAAMVLIKPDFKITQEHGRFFDRNGVTYTALYHPAALLRDPRRRPETFEDLKAIQEKIRQIAPEAYSL